MSAYNKGTIDEVATACGFNSGIISLRSSCRHYKRLIIEIGRAAAGECLAKCNEEKIYFDQCTYSVRTFTELNFL
jgi:hypothetical protein